MNDWDAEHVVDEAAARTLLATQFPQLELHSVKLIGVGWDNTVYAVDGAWVFRFPRRVMAVDLFARETALLPRLAPRLPLPVPVPELVGVPADGYPWPFWGGPLVPGVELADAAPPDEAREDLAVALGGFLRALHDPGIAGELGADLPTDPMQRATPSVRSVKTREVLHRLAARGGWDAESATATAVDDLHAVSATLAPPSGQPVLVHGDLHLRHLMVDPDGRATGVIDWGDACLADPAVDLSIAYAVFSGTARAALFESYAGEVDEERELRARVLAVNLCAALADYAHTEGHQALLVECLAGIARAVA